MKTLFMLVALLSLVGCATCERHPVACTIGGAFIVGSVAATVAANSHHSSTTSQCNAVGPDGRVTGVIGACVPR